MKRVIEILCKEFRVEKADLKTSYNRDPNVKMVKWCFCLIVHNCHFRKPVRDRIITEYVYAFRADLWLEKALSKLEKSPIFREKYEICLKKIYG